MKVNALDHVNIICEDLPGSAKFYAELLDLEVRDGPAPFTRAQAQWIHDDEGRAIFHLNSVDCPRRFEREAAPGPTGAVHHVALRCTGHGEMVARLEARNLEFACSDIPAIGLKQIFVKDPNDVLLELNFFGD